jgi:hypothetical protein
MHFYLVLEFRLMIQQGEIDYKRLFLHIIREFG